MKRTAFYQIHQKLGAKIVSFAGFEMPIQYSSIINETLSVRRTAGIFDVSHMGEIIIKGKDALNFVQKVTINDASKLKPGKVQYSAFCYEDGGIVDDLLVYNFGEYFMFVVNASNKDKDFEWLNKHKFGDVVLEDVSDQISLLAVQGPNSLKTLQKLTNIDLSEIKYYSFVNGKLANVDMIISRTGYTGELGFELYFKSDVQLSERVWNAIAEAGKEFEIQPVGLGARDTLRLEMGYCLYGNDIDHTTNPIEAGLGWITKLDKPYFIGKESLMKINQNGINRKLVGFVLTDEKAFPRKDYEIYVNGNKIGVVTSGTYSPTLEKGIGMGYVKYENSMEGNAVDIKIRNQFYRAEIVKPPFVKK